jgi:hypothetical protein
MSNGLATNLPQCRRMIRRLVTFKAKGGLLNANDLSLAIRPRSPETVPGATVRHGDFSAKWSPNCEPIQHC